MVQPRRPWAGRGALAPLTALVVLATALLLAGAARAELSCQASVDRTAVARGGQVTLTVVASGDGASAPQHAPPRIDGVRVVSGGTSQSFQLVDGEASLEVSSTYYLEVERDTDFEIPGITFRAGDETCTTAPVAVEVVGAPGPGTSGNRGAPPAGSSRPGPSDDRAEVAAPAGPAAGAPGDPMFITVTVDRDQVWAGEQVVMVFRYFRYRSSWGRPSYTAPRTEGFWRVDLPPERNYRRSIRGHVYDVTEIRYALFPTRAGELRIGPAVLEVAGDPFDRFFGRRGGSGRLQTEPITITVRELPAPQPRDFSGVVASQLEFAATVDRDTVPRGEPVSLTLTVAADAFLKGFDGVALPASDGLQIHDAAEDLREHLENNPRYRATFRQEKAMVPLKTGTLEPPQPRLVYFDTGQDRYVTARASVPPVVVVPSDLPAIGDDPSGFRRTEIARLGNDLAFVHAASGDLRRARPPLTAQPLWWATLLAPWLLLGFYRLHLGRVAAARRDPLAQRRRQAWPRAERALGRLGDRPDPADLARAITSYVADVSGRAPAGLTASDVRAFAADRGAASAGDRLARVLTTCDGARFGGVSPDDLAGLADQVRELLRELERARPRTLPAAAGGRSAGEGPAAGVGLLLAAGLAVALASPLAARPDRAAGPAPGVDPARLLAEGNQAYTEGALDTALVRYRQALAAGADDAALHYNLGNAHARRGELGRAIASYLRAQRLAPREADIRTNLQWVRSHTQDLELAGGGLPPVVAQLDAAAHQLSLDEWAAVLVALAWLTAGLLAWWWRRGWLGTWWRRLLLGAGASLLIVAVVVATRWYEERVRDAAVVVVEEAEVRSGPATTFPVVFRIHDGLTLVIRGERDGWARIGLGGDWVGWVPAGALEPVRRADAGAGADQGR